MWEPCIEKLVFSVVLQSLVKNLRDSFSKTFWNSKSCYLRTWFKGADTYAVARWVEFKFRDLPAPGWEDFRDSIFETAKCANTFLSTLYRNGLWLQPALAGLVIRCGMGFLQEYRVCAQFAYEDNKCRYKIPPKYHAFCHITHTLIEYLGKVGEQVVHENLPSILSPLAWSCQLDEDFVGQISALSRTGDLNHAHEKAMNLYLMNLPKYWDGVPKEKWSAVWKELGRER